VTIYTGEVQLSRETFVATPTENRSPDQQLEDMLRAGEIRGIEDEEVEASKEQRHTEKIL
jgi:hypothetical protein